MEEAKKKKWKINRWNAPFIGAQEKINLLEGNKSVLLFQQRDHLRKDVASIYDLVATSVHKNLGEEESDRLKHEDIEEVEYAEDFHHTPTPELYMIFLFQVMRIYQWNY